MKAQRVVTQRHQAQATEQVTLLYPSGYKETVSLLYGNGCVYSPAEPGVDLLHTGCAKCPFPDCQFSHNTKSLKAFQVKFSESVIH